MKIQHINLKQLYGNSHKLKKSLDLSGLEVIKAQCPFLLVPALATVFGI